jgi:thiol-disulfide isomerase/thioredoxin
MTYIKLKKSESLKNALKNKNKAVVAVLAPWCGYCEELKSSGLLKEIAKTFTVIELDDKHNESSILMKYVGSKSYPTIGIYKNGKMVLFKKERTEKNIRNEIYRT